MLLGDEPRKIGLGKIRSRLVDQLFQPLSDALRVGREVSVIFTGMPEDPFHAAFEPLLIQIILSGSNKIDELGVEITMRLGRTVRRPIGPLGSAVCKLDDGDCVVGVNRLP